MYCRINAQATWPQVGFDVMLKGHALKENSNPVMLWVKDKLLQVVSGVSLTPDFACVYVANSL